MAEEKNSIYTIRLIQNNEKENTNKFEILKNGEVTTTGSIYNRAVFKNKGNGVTIANNPSDYHDDGYWADSSSYDYCLRRGFINGLAIIDHKQCYGPHEDFHSDFATYITRSGYLLDSKAHSEAIEIAQKVFQNPKEISRVKLEYFKTSDIALTGKALIDVLTHCYEEKGRETTNDLERAKLSQEYYHLLAKFLEKNKAFQTELSGCLEPGGN